MKKISLIGAHQGWGARRSGCEDGPKALKESGVLHALQMCGLNASWTADIAAHSSARGVTPPLEETLPHVLHMDERVYDQVRQELRHGHFPVVIGGDHSIAVGTWNGVVDELKSHEKFGLIWVDAHMDAHTPQTAHEGRWGGYYHGQPLSALLGEGQKEFIQLGENAPQLSPGHVCLIGIRSFEEGEKKFLEKHNVRVFYMDEVKERGLKAVFEEALQIASLNTTAFGLTIDMDGFDPKDAPGVGTNEKDGIDGQEFVGAVEALSQNEKFKALEITEFNPHRDEDKKTERLMKEILISIFEE